MGSCGKSYFSLISKNKLQKTISFFAVFLVFPIFHIIFVAQKLTAMSKEEKDMFTREWIIENSIRITRKYEDGLLTLRALHYQLVAIGMTNTIRHYKRVVAAMEGARWDGLIDFEKFSDMTGR